MTFPVSFLLASALSGFFSSRISPFLSQEIEGVPLLSDDDLGLTTFGHISTEDSVGARLGKGKRRSEKE